MAEKEYFCTLTPMGEYFLGGERTFAFGVNEQGGKSDYYIKSENMPSQATVLGALRFLVLKKANCLSNGYKDRGRKEEQAKLVGAQGFSVGGTEERTYGKLRHLGPVFLWHDGRRLIRAPLNHDVSAAENDAKKLQEEESDGKPVFYHPMAMQPFPGVTDFGEGTLMPTGYDAKKGLFWGFVDIDGGEWRLFADDDIFSEQEHTRIAKHEDDEAFFKKGYKHFNDGAYRFAFYCVAEEDALPGEEIVYLGQDKSVFRFDCCPVTEKTGSEASLLARAETLPGLDGAAVFCAVSDLYMEIDGETEKLLAYSIVRVRPFRTMEEKETTASFVECRQKSKLYQLVRAGSVFYVRSGMDEAFLRQVKNPAMEQIGFNFVRQLGGR